MTNNFLEAMKFRFAAKEFDESRKISDDDFAQILEYARLSPSSFGYEPWKFLMIQNQELRQILRGFTWGASKSLPTASHFVIILARNKTIKYGSDYIKHIEKDVHLMPDEAIVAKGEFYEKFQKNDLDLLQSDRSLFDWSSKQTYIALANMMSGAAYMGIDSCPIEGFDMQKAQEFIKNELKINTDEFGVSVMVAFGYRKNEPKRQKTRQSLQDITSWYN